MILSRNQRIQNIGAEIISVLRRQAEHCTALLEKGHKIPAGNPPGHPALECTGKEVCDALEEKQLKEITTALEYILDGKSNRILKGQSDQVLMWLGKWRDKLPTEAVEALQKILDGEKASSDSKPEAPEEKLTPIPPRVLKTPKRSP